MSKIQVEILDATCPFVKRIHGIVEKAQQEGRLPVIIGTRSHPEVEGIAGWCGDCRIFETPEQSDFSNVSVSFNQSNTENQE